jgi:hypothetical protein
MLAMMHSIRSGYFEKDTYFWSEREFENINNSKFPR